MWSSSVERGTMRVITTVTFLLQPDSERDRETGRKKTCLWGVVKSTCLQVCMEARSQYQMSSSVILPYILRLSLSLNLELVDGARLAGPRIFLPLPSQLWGYKLLPWHSAFPWALGIKLRSSCLHCKLFIY